MINFLSVSFEDSAGATIKAISYSTAVNLRQFFSLVFFSCNLKCENKEGGTQHLTKLFICLFFLLFFCPYSVCIRQFHLFFVCWC